MLDNFGRTLVRRVDFNNEVKNRVVMSPSIIKRLPIYDVSFAAIEAINSHQWSSSMLPHMARLALGTAFMRIAGFWILLFQRMIDLLECVLEKLAYFPQFEKTFLMRTFF
ncbi:hypothetical protein P4H70_01760 [Paenibacillus ehimensis]|uniref:hypothetical protein n=1 Tax=Paenibacillus ehimensis TaxID=79264 RepID=UPI002DB88269|nr:hypothetical protein [Paenibacillus ehimensis]MEC0207663.1 hypothetical protein [Paenibacillus ehimensis]